MLLRSWLAKWNLQSFGLSGNLGKGHRGKRVRRPEPAGSQICRTEELEVRVLLTGSPVVTPSPLNQATLPEEYSFSLGDFVGGDGPWTVSVNWDDNSPGDTFSVAVTGAIPLVNHTYVTEGIYTPQVTVTDFTGNSGAATFDLAIYSLAVYLDASQNLVISNGFATATPDSLTLKMDALHSQYILSDPNHILSSQFQIAEPLVGAITSADGHVVTVPFASVSGPQIEILTMAARDQLTVDFSLGSLNKKLIFGGAPGQSDLLNLVGGTFTSVVDLPLLTPDLKRVGEIELTDATGIQTIVYANVSPVRVMDSATNFTFEDSADGQFINIVIDPNRHESGVAGTYSLLKSDGLASLNINASSGDADAVTLSIFTIQPTLIVQWQRNANGAGFEDIVGANMPSYAIPADQAQGGYLFRAVVNNGVSTFNSAFVTLSVLASVTAQPHDLVGVDGQTAYFIASAQSTPAPAAAWETSPDYGQTWLPFVGQTTSWSDATGQTTSTLSFPIDPVGNGNEYRAAFTNENGTAYSEPATLTLGTATFWIGGGHSVGLETQGDPDAWSNPFNWTNGVPNSDVFAVLDESATKTVSYINSDGINSVLTIHPSRNPVVDIATSVAGIYITPGAVSFLHQSRIVVAAALNVTGLSEWDSADIFMMNDAVFSIDVDAVLVFNNVNVVGLRGGGTLLNEGLIVQTGIANNLIIDGGNRLTNAQGATFDIEGDVSITGGTSGTGEFKNRGLLVKSHGTPATGATIAVKFVDDGSGNDGSDNGVGTIHVARGNLTILHGEADDRPESNYRDTFFIVDQFATLNLTGVFLSKVSGTLRGSGEGHLNFNGGYLRSDAAGATFAFADQFFHWNGGNLQGTWTNSSTGFVTLSGQGDKILDGVLNNFGMVHQTTDGLRINQNALLNNRPLGTFELDSSGGIRNVDFTASGSFLNEGVLLKADTTSSTINSRFTANVGPNGQGRIHVVQGNLLMSLHGPVPGSGVDFNGADFVLDSDNSVVTLIDPNNVTVAGTMNFTGAGRVEVHQGVLTAVTPATLHAVGAKFIWSGGLLQGDWTNTGTMFLSTLPGSEPRQILGGSVLHNKSLIVETSELGDNLQIREDGLLDNQAGATIRMESSGGITDAAQNGTGDFLNRGTILKFGINSSSTISTHFTSISDHIHLYDIDVQQGQLEIKPSSPAKGQAVNYDGTEIYVGLNAVLDPTGGANVIATGLLAGIGLGQVILSHGSLQAGSGGATLSFERGVLQWTGGELDGGSDPSSWHNAGSITLSGSGAGPLTFAHDLTNDGTIVIMPSRTLLLNGNFTQSPAAVLELRLGGVTTTGQFGQVALTTGHTATLGGTLKTVVVNGYLPVVGDTFTLLSYSDNLATTFNHFSLASPTVPFSAAVDSTHVTVTVLNNSLPVFTSPAAFNVVENLTVVGTSITSDADLPVQTVTFSITGGTDSAKFSMTNAGVLTFIVAPDFEIPTDSDANNIYNLEVTANDGNGGLTTQNIAVTVTPSNDNSPVFTSLSAFSIAENQSAVSTVAATDADRPIQTVTYSVTGGVDAARFSITSAGILTFITAPDFEVPTDTGGNHVYELQVTANDGAGRMTVQNIAVTVTNMTEGVSISLAQAPLSYHADKKPVAATIDAAATFNAGAATPSLAGAKLIVSFSSGGLKGDVLGIRPSGSDGFVVKSKKSLVFDVKKGQVFATISFDATTPKSMTITFTNLATSALVQKVMRAVTFSTKIVGTSPRIVQMNLNNLGGLNSNSATRQIAVH